MKFLAVFVLAALAALPAEAKPKKKGPNRRPASVSCAQGLANVIAELEKAEAANGTGQLEACIPAKDKGQSSEKILQQLREAVAQWTPAYEAFKAALPQLHALADYTGRAASHICEGPKEHQALAKQVFAAIGPAVSKLSNIAHSIGYVNGAFEKQYGYRWRKPESYLPLRFTANCRDTQRSVEAVKKAFQPAVAACKAEYQEARTADDDASEVGVVVANDCKKVKPRCEAVPWAGDRNGYNYGIDLYDEYGKLTVSKQYSTDTLESRNDALDRIRDCCDRTEDPRECQE